MRIRELRLGRGWSQERLAELSGLSVRTIQRIENGQPAGVGSMRAIAEALGVGMEQLVTDDGAVPEPRTVQAAVRVCLTKYADFDGRARRAEFWWFVVFVALAGAAAALVHEVVGGLVLVSVLLPLVAAGTRRLRDAGHSGWWQLLHLVPFGGVVPLILLTLPSSVDEPSLAQT